MSFLKIAQRRVTVKPEKTERHNACFGRDLNELLADQNRTIPIVVQQCVEWLEKNGKERVAYSEPVALMEEGLFRIPGSMNHIQRLVYLYNKGNRIPLLL